MKSKYFKSYFKKYWKSFLKKKTTKYSKRKSRSRNFNSRQIQLRILNEKRVEKIKFFTKSFQKKHWNVTNHLALFNHDVLKKNEINSDEIFHEKMINDIEKKRITCNLIHYRTQVATFFKIKRFSFRQNDNFDENEIVHDKKMLNASSTFKKSSIIAQSTRTFSVNSNKTFFANLKNVFVDTENAFLNEISSIINSAIRINSDKTFFANLKIVFVDTENVFLNEIFLVESLIIRIENEDFFFYDLTLKDFFDFNVMLFEIINVNEIQMKFENNSKNKTQTSKYLNCHELLMINAKRMIQKNISSIFDIEHRFWKCWLIDAMMKTKENIKMLHNMIDVVFNTKKMIKLNFQIWINIVSQFSIEKDVIVYATFDEKIEKNFDAIERYLDNFKYQSQNHIESCVTIEIKWQKKTIKYRIFDMSYNQELYFWQFVIINWLREMIANQILRDCILENYMNFDKTIEIIAYLLTIRSKRFSLYIFLLFFLDSDVEKDFLYIFFLLKVMLKKTFSIHSLTSLLTMMLKKTFSIHFFLSFFDSDVEEDFLYIFLSLESDVEKNFFDFQQNNWEKSYSSSSKMFFKQIFSLIRNRFTTIDKSFQKNIERKSNRLSSLFFDIFWNNELMNSIIYVRKFLIFMCITKMSSMCILLLMIVDEYSTFFSVEFLTKIQCTTFSTFWTKTMLI